MRLFCSEVQFHFTYEYCCNPQRLSHLSPFHLIFGLMFLNMKRQQLWSLTGWPPPYRSPYRGDQGSVRLRLLSLRLEQHISEQLRGRGREMALINTRLVVYFY